MCLLMNSNCRWHIIVCLRKIFIKQQIYRLLVTLITQMFYFEITRGCLLETQKKWIKNQ